MEGGSADESRDSLLVMKESEHPLSSPLYMFSNIVIAIIGAGVLGLPYAFAKAGWLSGLILLFVAAILSYWGMMLLVFSRRKMEESRPDCPPIATFGDLGFQLYGSRAYAFIDILLCLSQGGFCVAYLIFIGENVSSIFGGNSSKKGFIIACVAPVEIVLSWLRSLTYLAPFSLFADVVKMAALSMILFYDVRELQDFQGASAFTSASSIPFFLGIAVYAFEGVGMTLPLELSVKDKNKFGSTLALALSIIAVVYALFGSMGYLAFGKETRDIITLNLPQGIITHCVKVGFCISLFFTFPVMMHPVYEIFERRISLSSWFQNNIGIHGEEKQTAFFSALRAVIVVFVAYLAISIPQFSTFLSIIGSSVCSLLAFIIPGLLHLRAMGEDIEKTDLFADWFLIVFGAIFGIWGTIDTIRGLIGL